MRLGLWAEEALYEDGTWKLTYIIKPVIATCFKAVDKRGRSRSVLSRGGVLLDINIKEYLY